MPTNYLKPTDEHFAQKLVDALSVGLKQMAEKAAANDESLVIGYLDGTFAHVPAKELLKSLPEKGK